MAETNYGGFKKCTKCGRRSIGEVCSACRTMSSRPRAKKNEDEEFQKRTKSLSSDGMVEDAKPTAGIGESLTELEKALSWIDDECTSKMMNELVEAEHKNDMHT